MPWPTYVCPLSADYRNYKFEPTTTAMAAQHQLKLPRTNTEMERRFVVDAIPAAVNASLPRHSVIPPYDALRDKYASAYFQSPTVQAALARNSELREVKDERNKLSTRRRCKATPNPDQLRARRQAFVSDSIKAERTRTKFEDIIPPYQADRDRNCKRYFQRKDIRQLLSVTLSPR